MNISEKVAYLKGLAEGLEISSDSKNGRIVKGILDVLEDIAASMQTLEEENETLEDYITEVDEDLGTLEENFMRSCRHKVHSSPNSHAHHDCGEKHKHHAFDNFTIDDDDDDFDDLDDDYDEDTDDDDVDDDDDMEEFDDDENEDEEDESGDNAVFDGVAEIKCPSCGNCIYIETNELLNNDCVDCPECGEEIAVIDVIDSMDDSGCSCPHCAHSHGAEAKSEDETKETTETKDKTDKNDIQGTAEKSETAEKSDENTEELKF